MYLYQRVADHINQLLASHDIQKPMLRRVYVHVTTWNTSTHHSGATYPSLQTMRNSSSKVMRTVLTSGLLRTGEDFKLRLRFRPLELQPQTETEIKKKNQFVLC